MLLLSGCWANPLPIHSGDKVLISHVIMAPKFGIIDKTGRRQLTNQTAYNQEEKDHQNQEAFVERLTNQFGEVLKKKGQLRVASKKVLLIETNSAIQHDTLREDAQKIGADITIGIHIAFYFDFQNHDRWEAESDPFQPKKTRYWRSRVDRTDPTILHMIVQLVGVNKKGEQVFDETIEVSHTGEEIEVSSQEAFELNMMQSQLFDAVTNRFLITVSERVQ